MKKNTLRKLTLSAVTMGVAALSLTSTTYAWFTTNGTATASGINGTVAAAESNMLIKTASTYSNGTSGTWAETFTKTAEFKDAVGGSNNVSMSPVTWDASDSSEANHKFKKAGTTTGKFDANITANVDVLHYEVVFAITNLSTSTNTVTASFSDFVGDDTEQYLLVTDKINNAGKTIKVNVLDALSVRIESTLITTNDYGITTDTSTLMEEKNLTSTNANYRYKAEEQTTDAITYYNNVYGLTENQIVKPTKYEGYATSSEQFLSGGTITLFSVQGVDATVGESATPAKTTAYVKTDLYFYIDGWDYQCFNCLGGKGITEGNITFNLN